jgi:hypothetical protein
MTDQGFFGTDPAGLTTAKAESGQTIDTLLDVTNSGWRARCHLPERTENGMLFSFDVAPRPEAIR